MLENITPEQRAEYLEQGRIARQEKIKWAETNLDMDWGEDEAEWRRLGSLYQFRLPQRHISNTETKYVKRLFKHLGVDIKEYLEDCGVTTLKQLNDMNPREPAFAAVGFVLEWYHEKQTTDTLHPIEYEED